MNRGVGLVLGLMAVVAALWLGYMATTRIQYLPERLWSQPVQPWPEDEVGRVPLELTACWDKPVMVVDDFLNDWFSRHWRAANEPSLYTQSEKQGVLRSERFTWLRSFHAPVFVRIDWLPNDQIRMTAKELTGRGGYDPGEIARTEQRILSADEGERLEEARDRLRPFQRPAELCGGGLDGARWILESAEAGNYIYITRWSPEAGPVRAYSLMLLDLTGWRYEHVY